MPWEAGAPGHGFTDGTPWLPFGPDASTHAVDVQVLDPDSVLSTHRRLLARRRAPLPVLGNALTWLQAPDELLAVRRGPLVAVLNTPAEPVELTVDDAIELLEATAPGAALTGRVVTVPGAATVWVGTG